MKTKILAITLFALILGSAVKVNANDKDTGRILTPSAQTEFQASIQLLANDIVRFNVIKPDDEKVRLRVYSEGGILIYSYILRKNSSAKIGFDTRMLSPGKYQYVVERSKEEVLRKTIEKKN
jgi:hypothetical protein